MACVYHGVRSFGAKCDERTSPPPANPARSRQQVGGLGAVAERTDREIDRVVYDQYGLTEAERRLVEKETRT